MRPFRRSLPLRLAVGATVVALLWSVPAASAVQTPQVPAAPTGVRAVALTPSQVTVEWQPGGTGTVSYTVRRNGVAIASVDAATRSFSDTAVAAGQRYTYVVEALGAGGPSAAAAAGVKTPTAPGAADRDRPTVPDDLHAVARPDGSVLVDWQGANDDTDISAYVVRRGNRQVAVVDAGTLRFVDTRPGGGSAPYTVEAVDIAGRTSGRSEPATVEAATTPAPAARTGATTGATGAAPTAGSTAFATAAFSDSLRRYPYLTDDVNSADSTSGFATINWATLPTSTTASALWGAVDGNGDCNPTNVVAAVRTGLQANGTTLSQWKANLTLAPDTEYCYRVRLGAADLLLDDPSPRFRTLPPTGATAPFSFAVFGDWGQVDSVSQNPDQANVMAQIAASGARFALTTGDNAYSSGSQSNYGDMVEFGPEISGVFGPSFWTIPGRSIPLFAAIGNHGLLRNDANHPHFVNWPQDRAVSESGGRYQKDTYCCLLGTASLTLPSTWYAFDAGPVRIYVLQAAWSDTNGGINADPYEVDAAYQWTPGSPQYTWLQQDLAAHPGQIKMAAFHYPLYSDQKHESSDTFLQGPGSLQGLLDQYGVKFAFNGHAHIYQRNRPDAAGLVSYVTGGGGGKTQSVGEDPCLAIDAYAIGWSNSSGTGNACGAASPPSANAQVFHFLKVTVDGSLVTVAPIDSLGRPFDVQTYDTAASPDTEPPSVPTGVAAVASSASQVDVTWSASTDDVAVTGYDVLRDGVVIATVAGDILAYADASVAPSTTYGYQVIASDGTNRSDPSSPAVSVTTPAIPDTEAPSAPSEVTATAVSSSLVRVAWSASTDNVGVTGYDVLRDGAPIGSVAAGALAYDDATVAAATNYRYEIVARDLAGNPSLPSAAATVTTPRAPVTLVFPAVEDSTTDATTPGTNLGSSTSLLADTSPAQRAYLKFVASGIGGPVVSAVVRLRVTDSTPDAPQIASTTNGWTESGLTWANQPAPGAVVGDLGSVSKNTTIDYPVTVAIGADGTYSFVLLAQSSNGLGVASRQATLASRPQLVVTYR
jgi:fibronectin type 3 domain-containing protein